MENRLCFFIWVGPQQVVDIKIITCLFWLQIRDLFGAKKGDMGKSSESCNALSDAEKCDTGPENAYFWA